MMTQKFSTDIDGLLETVVACLPDPKATDIEKIEKGVKALRDAPWAADPITYFMNVVVDEPSKKLQNATKTRVEFLELVPVFVAVVSDSKKKTGAIYGATWFNNTPVKKVMKLWHYFGEGKTSDLMRKETTETWDSFEKFFKKFVTLAFQRTYKETFSNVDGAYLIPKP